MDLERFLWPASAFAFYASGWIVTATSVPAAWRLEVSATLVAVGGVAVLAGARAVGVDLEGGRCKARTNDGTRCRLSRRPRGDLCHVHRRTHDVELHPSAVDGTVATEAAAGDAGPVVDVEAEGAE